MSTSPDCACDAAPHPRPIANPPGRTAVDYRTGDYTAFRRALLVSRRDEFALQGWHPEPSGSDLALQLLEWWAYLADVLTFYNERAIQETLLRTATLPENVRRIVRLLGYRPRPGIGATGVVAALTDAIDPFVVPRGFAIEGANATGLQVFELDEDVEIGRVGKLLPKSARFPVFQPSGPATPPSSSTVEPGAEGSQPDDPAARGPKRRLRNSVAARFKHKRRSARAGEPFPVFLDGVVASVQPGDLVLMVKRDWPGHIVDPFGWSVTTVRAVKPLFDTAVPTSTGLELVPSQNLSLLPGEMRILRPTKLAHLWLYHERYPGSSDPGLISSGVASQVIKTVLDPLGLFHGGGIPTQPPQDPRVLTGMTPMGRPPPHGVAHLEAITRGISAGDLVLFEKRSGGGLAALFERMLSGTLPAGSLAFLRPLVMQLVKVSGYAEDIWYANAPEMDRVGMGPPVGPPGHGVISGGEGPIPIPHSRISFDINPFLDMMALGDIDLNKIVVHYGWEEVGEEVPKPSRSQVPVAVEVDALPDRATKPVPVLLSDQNGRGDYGWLGQTTSTSGSSDPGSSGNTVTTELVPPLQALLNLLPVSRGQTVAREVLGSGDPLASGQEFVLKQAPLTYLADTGLDSTNGYRSTLRIRVDGIEWREVPSFYGQPQDARVFVTREDEAQKTHVRFGDGGHGARLPAGTGNVVATYRYGSGAAIPPVGSLTTILRPQPGLVSIVNPVPVGGGADPEQPDQLQRYAPRSVLSFGRVVSGDDYEAVAAQTPGVRRARVYWSWDAASQRTVVKVFVGDDDAAVAAARQALAALGDPNRPAVVALAAPVIVDLTLRLEIDPAYLAETVQAQVARLLLDPLEPPFGADVIRIGASIYDSQIYDACRRIPGVIAVHGLRFGTWTSELSGGGAGGTASEPPRPPTLTGFFGQSFHVGDVFNPLSLAIQVGGNTNEQDILDPFALAEKLAIKHGATSSDTGTGSDASAASQPNVREVVTLESSERHSPGEGRFYQLREERLHISAEIARHVL